MVSKFHRILLKRLFLSVALTLLTFACSRAPAPSVATTPPDPLQGSSETSPSQVVNYYLSAFDRGDFEGASELISVEIPKEVWIRNQKKKVEETKWDLLAFKILDEKIRGDQASVNVDISVSFEEPGEGEIGMNGKTEYLLSKIGGKWKIHSQWTSAATEEALTSRPGEISQEKQTEEMKKPLEKKLEERTIMEERALSVSEEEPQAVEETEEEKTEISQRERARVIQKSPPEEIITKPVEERKETQPEVEFEQKEEPPAYELPPPPLPEELGEGRYTVQVGSFRTEDAANEFAQDLKYKGYPAFVKRSEVPGKGVWYRVRLGHFKTRGEALAYGQKLTSQEKSIKSVFVTLDN